MASFIFFRMASFILLIMMLCTAAQAQVTPSPVCLTVKSGTTIPTINLATEFSVRMEIVTQESQRVSNIRMFYSKTRNQIKLSMLDSGIKSDMFFYFQDNEILSFDYSKGRGSCTVNNNLVNASDTFIVGGSKDNRIQAPLAVLHLLGQSGFGDDIKLKSLGTTSVRDMDVDAYYSCQKWSFGQQSAIVNVTHYFSSKSWARPDPSVVPIMIEIHGSAVLHNQVMKIDHWYNFFDFQTSFDATVFETPPGIVCQGRNAGLDFPNLPNYIKFSGETIDQTLNHVVYFEEIYDADDDFVVLRTQMNLDLGTQGGMNHYTYIRDYPTGLSYSIDNTNQLCWVQNITDSTPLPTDFITSQGKVQEVTPEQLFYKTDTKYEYLGQRVVRGMTADTWVTRTNIPAYPENEVTVEWYFAEPGVTSWNDGSSYYTSGQFRMPVLMRIWLDDVTAQSIDTNIYHVDYTNIMYGVLDIRNCYPDSPSNYVQIVLNGAKELVMNTNIDQFKWSTVSILAEAAGVRRIRIADLQVYYDDDDAVIQFELLDAAPYASDISGTPYQGISLQRAMRNIRSAIANGTLAINVWDSATNQIDKPIKATSPVRAQSASVNGNTPARGRNPSRGNNDNGYSAGAMAGLGIAMLIAGGAGGSVGAHFFIK